MEQLVDANELDVGGGDACQLPVGIHETPQAPTSALDRGHGLLDILVRVIFLRLRVGCLLLKTVVDRGGERGDRSS